MAYYWEGAVSKAHPIRDINSTGAYLVTDERWYIGTLVMFTLQQGEESSDRTASVTIASRIVRHGLDGVGVNFMLSSKQERQALRQLVQADSRAPVRRSTTSGEAVVEFALMVPLLFLLIVNAFNFGGFIYCWLTVADAVRAAGDYASIGSNTVGSPATPDVTKITTLVQNATAVLPNYSTSNPTVTACVYNNGTTNTFLTTSACPAGVAVPPADLERIATGASVSYSTVALDVTYTFTPFLAGSTFLRFGLPALPTSIHRRMVVRWP